jgi:hypothetical protein
MMRKTQIGWAVIIIVLIVESISIVQYPGNTNFMILTAGMILMLLLFGTLTIVVTGTHLKFFFGIGLIRAKYSFSDIVYCRPINYFSLGWGIRFKPGITIFNVSGNKAIEIRRRSSDQIIYIGTDAPEEVVDWVYKKMRKE